MHLHYLQSVCGSPRRQHAQKLEQLKSPTKLFQPGSLSGGGITGTGAAAELSPQEIWDQLTGFDRLSLVISTEENP